VAPQVSQARPPAWQLGLPARRQLALLALQASQLKALRLSAESKFQRAEKAW
jgi:hypothetical protein